MPAKVKDEFWKEYDRLKTERDKKAKGVENVR